MTDQPGIRATRPNPVPIHVPWNIHQGQPYDTQEFVGWYMVNIINHFLDMESRGELDLYQKVRFRQALLVSYEADCISRGERFYV